MVNWHIGITTAAKGRALSNATAGVLNNIPDQPSTVQTDGCAVGGTTLSTNLLESRGEKWIVPSLAPRVSGPSLWVLVASYVAPVLHLVVLGLGGYGPILTVTALAGLFIVSLYGTKNTAAKPLQLGA